MNENNFSRITKWIPILLLGVSIVATWTTLKNSDASQADEIRSLKSRTMAAETSNNQILVQLSQIQADLSWIRKAIDQQ